MMSANPWLPQLVLFSTAILCLVLGRFVRITRLWGPMGFLALGIAGWLLTTAEIDGDLHWDRFAISLIAGLLFLGGVLNTCTWQPDIQRFPAERQALLLCGIASATVTAATDNLIALLASVELCSLIVAGLLWTMRSDAEQTPASLPRRSLVLQAVSFGLILIAAGLLVWRTDTISLSEMQGVFTESVDVARSTGLPMPNRVVDRLAVVLLFSGLGMRLFFVPFHFGSPEILIASDSVTRGFLATILRAAAGIVLFRIAFLTVAVTPTDGVVVATVLASLTMLIGTALAIGRQTLGETMTYLIIGQGGVILAGLAAAWGSRGKAVVETPADLSILRGEVAFGLSAVVAMLSFAGLIALLISLHRDGRPVDFPEDLRGLMRDRPLIAAAIAVLLLNLVGVPPLPGFWSRLSTWGALLSVIRETGESGLGWHPAMFLTAIVVGLQAVLTAAIAFQLIAVMLFEPPVSRLRTGGNWPAVMGGVACALLTIVIGFSPTKTVRWLDAIIPNRPAVWPLPSGGSGGTRQASDFYPLDHRETSIVE